jgi:hypothetical protein
VAEKLQCESTVAMLRRDRVHTKDIATVLERLTRRLDEEGIPFALIGALAMRHHGYARHTEDIDLLTTPEGLDAIHERFVGRGLVPRAPGLRKKLRETEHRVDIDVITAGEHAGSADSPVVYPHPSGKAFLHVDGRNVPSLPLLITFKIGSGVWGHRNKDLGDVQELIKANRLGRAFARKLAAPLRPTFLKLLADVAQERQIE